MDVSWIPDGEEASFNQEDFNTELIVKLDETQDTTAETCRVLEAKID